MKSSVNVLDITLLLTRIFLGGIVFAHGAQKLFGWFAGYGFDGTADYFTETIGLPYLLAVLIILAESIGMITLVLGLFSRILSASVILIMLGAIFFAHGQFGFFMNWSGAQAGEGFEFHLDIIALAAVVMLQGAGFYSIDNYLLRKGWIIQWKPLLFS
jgi:putative oxidoreductase